MSVIREVRHYCRIEYDYPTKNTNKAWDAFDSFLDHLIRDPVMRVHANDLATCGGSPASYPYVEFWCEDSDRVTQCLVATRQVMKYLGIKELPF